jgi:pimeloyl-ACP methyl ester carboxylesterase
VAGTAIKGLAATLMMRRVLERHPNAFLVTLASFGVTIPLHNSQHHLAEDIRKGLLEQDRRPDSPVVMVGHSQGALASLRYALDHPEQVLHVFSVGAPWHGSRSAARVARLAGRSGRNITPALTDMAAGSSFLRDLHAELPRIADRVTNVYSTHEIVISPYVHAHIDVPGVSNILIAPEQEYLRHLQTFPEYVIDGHVNARLTHLTEMSSPAVRSLIWTKVDQVTARVRRGEIGPGARPNDQAVPEA